MKSECDGSFCARYNNGHITPLGLCSLHLDFAANS
jgi:hypothetical protein